MRNLHRQGKNAIQIQNTFIVIVFSVRIFLHSPLTNSCPETDNYRFVHFQCCALTPLLLKFLYSMTWVFPEVIDSSCRLSLALNETTGVQEDSATCLLSGQQFYIFSI